MKIFFLIFYFLSNIAIAENLPEQNVEKLATSLGVVYAGMPKEALYSIFTKYQRKGYYAEGTEEWITFSDWMTEKPGDLITFYLKNSKVKGWEEQKMFRPVKYMFHFRCKSRAISHFQENMCLTI